MWARVLNPSLPSFLFSGPVLLVDHSLQRSVPGVIPIGSSSKMNDGPTLPADGSFHSSVHGPPISLILYIRCALFRPPQSSFRFGFRSLSERLSFRLHRPSSSSPSAS